jgi:multidrug efflux pump subunit AcrB
MAAPTATPLSLTVSKTQAPNAVEVASYAQAALEIAATPMPDGVHRQDQSTFIIDSRRVAGGRLGAVFAVLTIFLFLFSLRARSSRR